MYPIISIEKKLNDLSTPYIQSEEDTQLGISDNVINMKRKWGDDIVQLGMFKKVKQLNESSNNLCSILNEDNIIVSENSYDRIESYNYYKENLVTSNGLSYLVGVANFATNNAHHHMSIG